MSTIEQLQTAYPANYLHLDALLRDHFIHITSIEYFIKQVKNGRIKIKLSRLDDTRKAPYIVWLSDLADFLDKRSEG